MVVWSDQLTNRDEIFDFQRLFKEFLYKYSYEPRLFFQTDFNNKGKSDNPFFKILEQKFKFKVILLNKTDNASQQTQILFNNLVPENLEKLILVGHSDSKPINELLKHHQATSWDITWIRSGQGQAIVPISLLEDTSKYIRKKSRR